MTLLPIVKWVFYPQPYLSRTRLQQHFAGRWVVITGATSGIGLALTRRLIQAGANLCLIARREDILLQLCQEAREQGCEALCRAVDLRDPTALQQLCEQLPELLPHVDYLFCNAGKSIHRRLSDALDRLHDYDRTMAVNYRPLVALSLALYPQLAQKQGSCILYTSSVSTLYPEAPGWSAYHASKAAANAWCRTADAEWAKAGLRVKVAYMPLVHTPMSDATPHYRQLPAYEADEAALLLLRLCLSRCATYRPWWAWLTAPLAQLFSPVIRFVYRRL